jgi:predicted XRE-type DNA-binding protein
MLDDQIPRIKEQLATEILRLAAKTNMWVAAKGLGIDIARMSDLRHGRVARFSIERLIKMLAAIDWRVEVRIVADNYEAERDPWAARLRPKLLARREQFRRSLRDSRPS